MKLVREYINEIKKGGSSLNSIDVGKSQMIKKWAEENFDEFTIKDGVIYPVNPDEYPSVEFQKSIPSFIRIIAQKPYEKVEVGDRVVEDEGTHEEMFVTNKIPYDTPNIKSIIDEIAGEGAYDASFKMHVENETNMVETERYSYEGTVKHEINPYDPNWGVIATYIYPDEYEK